MKRERHYHCPLGHEHPQPFRRRPRGWLLCGLCWFWEGRVTRMRLCTPELCGE
jgi:hypothetical protein